MEGGDVRTGGATVLGGGWDVARGWHMTDGREDRGDAVPESGPRVVTDRSEAPTDPPQRDWQAEDPDALASSGERRVFSWLQADPEDPRQSSDVTRVSFDSSGRYLGASPDRSAVRRRRLRRLTQQWAVEEYALALATAERMLLDNPADREALAYAEDCRAKLEEMYVATLGGRLAVFRLQAGGRIREALETDDRTRLLLALVRRGASLGEILDAHGPARLDVLLVFARLAKARVLERS